VPDGLGLRGEPAGVAQESPDHRGDQRTGPEQLLLQRTAAGLAPGERRDLRVRGRDLSLQVLHPLQRNPDRLRARRRQAQPGTGVPQPGAGPRIGQLPGQAGNAVVEQRGVDPLGPGRVLLAQIPVQLQDRPHLRDLLRRDPRGRHPALGHQDAQVPGIGAVFSELTPPCRGHHG
jgi:hypothetical protein